MVKIEQMSRLSQCRKYLEHVSANSLSFKNSVETILGQMNLLTYILIIIHKNNSTQNKKKYKQGQFIIQQKTGLIFMKSKQRQRSKLRIPVLDKH
jgi:hypothetical protein